MPAFDGTGPFGDGRPGRGLGPCGRYGFTLGRGRGFRGANRRFGSTIPYSPNENDYVQPYNKESLQTRKRELEKEVKWLDEELKDIEQQNK